MTSTIESDGLRSGRNRGMATIRDRLGPPFKSTMNDLNPAAACAAPDSDQLRSMKSSLIVMPRPRPCGKLKYPSLVSVIGFSKMASGFV